MSNHSGKHKVLDIIAIITSIFLYCSVDRTTALFCVVTDIILFRHFTVFYLLSVLIINSNMSNNPGSHQTLDFSYLRLHSEEYRYDQELHSYLQIQSRRKTCCYTRQYTS